MSYLTASGIRFNDWVFSQPIPVANSAWPRCAGLYVVLVEDRNWAPRPYQPVFFGEFGNNAPADQLRDEVERFAKTGQGKPLLISVLPLPFSTSAQRWAVWTEMVTGYNPTCQVQEARTPAPDLIRRLDELEVKQREQTAQLLWLRASAHHLLGAPERRHRIGFVPAV